MEPSLPRNCWELPCYSEGTSRLPIFPFPIGFLGIPTKTRFAPIFPFPRAPDRKSGGDCGHLFLWSTESGQLLRKLRADRRVLNSLAPHPLLQAVAASGIDADIKPRGVRGDPFFCVLLFFFSFFFFLLISFFNFTIIYYYCY